jgi:hypothetical protein
MTFVGAAMEKPGEGSGPCGHRIRIVAGEISLVAELNHSPTAHQVCAVLPLEARASRWGDEIYFGVPVRAAEAEDAREEMGVGELAYWPPGRAFCIFFGPTPVSSTGAPRAYSPVNPIGWIIGDAIALRAVPDGASIRIEVEPES